MPYEQFVTNASYEMLHEFRNESLRDGRTSSIFRGARSVMSEAEYPSMSSPMPEITMSDFYEASYEIHSEIL